MPQNNEADEICVYCGNSKSRHFGSLKEPYCYEGNPFSRQFRGSGVFVQEPQPDKPVTLPPLKVTEEDWANARREGRSQFVTPIEAELACRERQLSEALTTAEKLTKELEEVQRAKYGTPCKCESWVDACAIAEERAETAEASLVDLRKAVREAYEGIPAFRIAIEKALVSTSKGDKSDN